MTLFVKITLAAVKSTVIILLLGELLRCLSMLGRQVLDLKSAKSQLIKL
jgi:hypothetical protein